MLGRAGLERMNITPDGGWVCFQDKLSRRVGGRQGREGGRE